MCGIAGYFGPNAVDEADMLARLHHRGPDARGAWRATLPCNSLIQLFHTRLKIVDLTEAAAQPMRLRRRGADSGQIDWGMAESTAGLGENVGGTNSTGDRDLLVLVFNGEIYNFPALRNELEGLGHRFRSRGDTEVLLHGYAEWGPAVFSRLDGMYAVAFYDGPRQQLVLARDHTGIKPLYHALTKDGGFLFASEVRAITGSGRCENRIDAVAVADYLRFGSCQEPRTLVEGVRALPPGHCGVIRLDEGSPAALITRAFWLPERVEVESDFNDPRWSEVHRRCLAETVREQIVADVPLGVFLSGGVDSTLLMELAAESGRDRIVAFTLAGTTEHDEGAIAAESARRAGVKHALVRLGESETVSWVRGGLAAMDQPSADGVNTYLVSRAARREGLVAVLAGTGADELHGVYGHAGTLARLIKTMQAVGPLRPALTKATVGGIRASGRPVQAERLAELLAAVPSAWQVVQEKRRFFTPRQIAAFWPPGSSISGGWTPPFVDPSAFGSRGVREQIRLAEIRGYLLNTLLRDCDWATMANHQELRVPFLGRRYMECVLRAPERATAARAGPKPRLVSMLSPGARHLATLPKRGFTLDYLGWLKGPLRAELLQAGEVLRRRLGFQFDANLQLRDLDATGSQKEARRLWALLALGRYLETNNLTN